MTHHAGKTEQLTKAKKSLLQRGGQGGWGPNQPAPSPPHRASETRALSPPCKGGARGGGGRINQLRRHLIAQAKPAHFPPLQRGGQGGWGPNQPAPSPPHRASETRALSPPLQGGVQGGWGPNQPAPSPPHRASETRALSPPLQGGVQGGWGPNQPAPSPPLRTSETRALPPPCKGGPGRWKSPNQLRPLPAEQGLSK